jgi:hypothetical protein
MDKAQKQTGIMRMKIVVSYTLAANRYSTSQNPNLAVKPESFKLNLTVNESESSPV